MTKRNLKQKKYIKIIILLILFVAVAGIAMSSVSAKTYTTTVKFNDSDGYPLIKKITKKQFISTYYYSGYSSQHDKNRVITIDMSRARCIDNKPTYDIIGAKITFTKKVNGETKTANKNYKANEWGYIYTQAPIGWTPKTAIVKYKEI